VLHRHLRDCLPDRFDERPERGLDSGRHGAAGIVVVEDRDPAPVLVVVDDRHEVLAERDGLAGLLVGGLPVLLRDERRGCKDGIVVEQPLLDEQAEGERDLVAVVLPQVRGLLADLDDAPEEGILVGRVGAVTFDDGVDPAVLGEIHCCCRRDRGVGRYGCWFWLGLHNKDYLNCWDILAVNFAKLRPLSTDILHDCRPHQRL